jgi:hypothetical protein
MAKSSVKTMKGDYVAFIPKHDAATAVPNLAIAFEYYNERHHAFNRRKSESLVWWSSVTFGQR